MSSSISMRAVAGAALALTLAAFGQAQAATPYTAFTSGSGVVGGATGPYTGVGALLEDAVNVSYNVAGTNSYAAFGDAANFVTFIQLAPFAEVTGSSWNVTLTAFDPSWLSEMQIIFTDSAITTGVITSPGFGNGVPGTQTFVGGGSLVTSGLNFQVGADGLLRIEFAESFDDESVNPDGTWVSGAFTFEVSAVPEPSTYGLMALGMLGVGAMVRRRRAD